jgi:hypothetical protein
MGGWFLPEDLPAYLEGVPGIGPGVKLGKALGKAVTGYTSGPSLGAVPGLQPTGKLVAPPTADERGRAKAQTDIEKVDPDLRQPISAAKVYPGEKNFTPPARAPDQPDTSILPGTDVNKLPPQERQRAVSAAGGYDETGFYKGPITPELTKAAGFAESEARDWASLGNWLRRGEGKMDQSAFTELFNGQQWTGSDKTHPKGLGWAGDRYKGIDTSAYGVFQDEYGTWVNDIAPKYLGGDTRMTPENQVKGNLMMAADLFQQRTGRNLLAAWRDGDLTSISTFLRDQWPTLTQQRAAAGGTGNPAADRAFQTLWDMRERNIAISEKAMHQLMEMAGKADPLSAEMREHLHAAMLHSEELGRKYEALMEKPPKSQTPIEAAGAMFPILVLLSALGGLATRRPALGAINALSGALEGLKTGNDQLFSNNVDLWKSQTGMAQKAFQIQNEVIGNLLSDINLSERERQQKLQDAFRFFQMDQELRLARENNWADLYKRLEDAPAHQAQRDLTIERAREALEQAQDKKFKKAHGVEDLGNKEYSTWLNEYREFKRGHPDEEPTEEDNLNMRERALLAGRRTTQGLTSAQQQKNDSIQEDMKTFGFKGREEMDDFQDEVDRANAANRVKGGTAGRLTADKLRDKGYSPRRIALYNALTDPTYAPDKNPEEAELIRHWRNARNPMFRPREGLAPEGQTTVATPTGQVSQGGVSAEALQAYVLERKGQGGNRESVKAQYLAAGAELGLSESDFNELWPEHTATPTGPVAPYDPSGGLGLGG